MVRCPPPLRRGATAASSPHSASPFPNQSLSPPGSSLSHSSSARRRAPSTARSSTSREGARRPLLRREEARRPPQGGPTMRGLAGRREGNPPRPSSSSPAARWDRALHPAPLAPAVPAPADYHGLHPGGICCCGRRGIFEWRRRCKRMRSEATREARLLCLPEGRQAGGCQGALLLESP